MVGLKKILVVDDNEDMRELLRTILEIEGYSVLLAQSGQEGLALANSTPDLSLILLDFQLGDLDGPGFVRLMKERSPEIYSRSRIVYITGESNPSLDGVLGFIPKMSDIKVLLKKVEQFIGAE